MQVIAQGAGVVVGEEVTDSGRGDLSVKADGLFYDATADPRWSAVLVEFRWVHEIFFASAGSVESAERFGAGSAPQRVRFVGSVVGGDQ